MATTVTTTTPTTSPETPSSPAIAKPDWRKPQLWAGMSAGGWLRLLARNRFGVDWRHVPHALSITLFSLSNSALGLAERALYSAKISRVPLPSDPIFIIGHWRTGTTMLHELLALDPRHTFPTNYASFAPNHFLLTERTLRPLLARLLPERRPMDEMALRLELPQEDEAGLSNLGLPSPFLTVAFPNRPLQDPRYVDLDGLSPAELDHWRNTLGRFLRKVIAQRPGRIVLKSPQHTWRLPVLAAMFPQARWINMTRDPFVVFPSTVHFWRAMYTSQGLQTPTFAGLEEFVLATLAQMHERLEATRHLVPRSRIVDLRYEDLVTDPAATLRRLYSDLELGEFNPVESRVEQYLSDHRSYKTNRYAITESQRHEVAHRWQPYFERYGYSTT